MINKHRRSRPSSRISAIVRFGKARRDGVPAGIFLCAPMRDTRVAMARQSLLEYFGEKSRPLEEAAVVWRRGYRTLRWSWSDLRRAAIWFAGELGLRGIAKGDRVLLWGENSGEWIAAFLGCMFAGAVAVPMDVTADAGFAGRVASHAGVQLAVWGKGPTVSG